MSKSFGGIRALDEVDLLIKPGTVHGLIGPNGSGKSTLVNVVTGLYRPSAGRIEFGGAAIEEARPASHGAKRHDPHFPEHPAVY